MAKTKLTIEARYVVRKLDIVAACDDDGRSWRWSVYDNVEKVTVDEANPCADRDEAKHRAGYLNRKFESDRAREASMDLIGGVVERLAAAVPAGWTATVGVGSKLFGEDWAEDGTKKRFVEFVHEDGHAVVVLNVGPVETYTDPWNGVSVEGDVLVDGGSFVRRGIDVACCWLRDARSDAIAAHDYSTVEALLAGEKARVDAYLERKTSAVAIPGLPFTRQPDWIAKAKADLKSGKDVTLLPHGMGTGYALSTRQDGGWSRRADAATAKFFDVDRLFVSTLDCD